MVNLPWQPAHPILTGRLALRPHRAGDLDDLLRYHSDPEVVRYIPWPVRTREQTEAALDSRTRQGAVTEEGQWLVLAIQLRDDVGLSEGGRVIGEVLLKFDSEADARGELGYAIARDAEGHGYATEAARAVLDLAFTGFGLHRVIARLDARNRASAALLERLGMRREALFIEDEHFKGEWTDTLVYALLEHEYRPEHIPEAG
ncbi:GNAT family N-acetyltransferase [Herbiconiux sp. VKM Ac-1786]|uniref:GNAT family N-acetyltransferase n=1 Tax=Herbiconiux sp. VKM Ac-1786 TaxID=2783824 RepID=UPI001889F0CE|nr:GNAT family N-acetyltransferase [Herbiconiux sp. VKM Ac-1786]MBF4572273.1 GNAT family N-acetyltransferase [Herbiconiux sp. VKM Ac-1786]